MTEDFTAHNGTATLDADGMHEALAEYLWGVSASDEECEAAHNVVGRVIAAYLNARTGDVNAVAR